MEPLRSDYAETRLLYRVCETGLTEKELPILPNGIDQMTIPWILQKSDEGIAGVDENSGLQ